MNKDRPTIAVYGIQDRINSPQPLFVHDHAIVVMNKGRVVKALTLERQTRVKHDNSLHSKIYDILKSGGLLADRNYDLVFTDNVVGRAFISRCGRFRFEAPLPERLAAGIERGKCWWLDREQEAFILNHELAHVFSNLPFYGNFIDNSLLVHFDGGASMSNFSAWHFHNGRIIPVESHWDLKWLTSMFNANALVFGIIGAKLKDQNSVPGKMMGLAGHGSYSVKIEKWLSGNDFFEDIWDKKTPFFEKAKKDFGWDKTHLHSSDPFLQDIIATMHHIFVREVTRYFSGLQDEVKADYLYYSGGSALNIVTNTALYDKKLFRDIFIPPACEDSGLALGAAAFVEWQKHGRVQEHSPYLLNWGIGENETDYSDADVEKTAELLMQKKVIGICNGNAEIGPRALGNRSILALADSKALAGRVSMEIKKREWYRPVAPVMLLKNSRYFTGRSEIPHLSRYMLLDFPVLKDKAKELEGAVHVDGTSRIQTISGRSENPYLFDLLTLLDEKYGVKALINTSFNVRGEPIVHTCTDALESAIRMKLDAVVLNGKVKELK